MQIQQLSHKFYLYKDNNVQFLFTLSGRYSCNCMFNIVVAVSSDVELDCIISRGVSNILPNPFTTVNIRNKCDYNAVQHHH